MTSSLSGYVDDNIGYSEYGVLVDAVLELVPDLTWPLSVRTYARMRHDTQLAAIQKAYKLPIQRASWAIDGTGCREEVVREIADDFGLPIVDLEEKPSAARRRGVTWQNHLRLALLNLTYGHMAFEQRWDEIGGKYRLGLLAERMPQTIQSIKIDDNGDIVSIQQHRRVSSSNPVVIKADRLVWYANEREGAAWFGQSLLRPSYGPWLIKDQILRVHATSIRRFGMGIPYAKAPAGALPQQIAEANRMISSMKASEQMGVALPQGFELGLAGLQGSVPDALAFLHYLDQQMTRSTLSQILDMATSQHGSRALGEVIMDVFILSLQAIADSIAFEATGQIIVPIVTANYGEDEPAPRLVCGDVGAQHEVTAESINLLFSSGALTQDVTLEDRIRELYKLPAVDLATRTAPPTTSQTSAPAAPSGTETGA